MPTRPNKKGATRAPARARPAERDSNAISPGTWFGTGFFCGMFACILAYVVMVPENTSDAPPAKPVAEKPEPEKTKTRFDFFTLLPEREVIVPAEEAAPPDITEEEAIEYLLQAGSFKNSSDAERRRANIILLGLQARIETVNANGDTWHRVYAGPFKLQSKLTKARALLIEEGIDTLLLKRKT